MTPITNAQIYAFAQAAQDSETQLLCLRATDALDTATEMANWDDHWGDWVGEITALLARSVDECRAEVAGYIAASHG